jgi:hypothetical protein
VAGSSRDANGRTIAVCVLIDDDQSWQALMWQSVRGGGQAGD